MKTIAAILAMPFIAIAMVLKFILFALTTASFLTVLFAIAAYNSIYIELWGETEEERNARIKAEWAGGWL